MKVNRYSLRALRTFVTVAECGTVAAAAVKLSRSQAAVSTTVSEFEATIGLELFVRQPARGLALTPAGEMVVMEARGLLAHADEFELIASALGNSMEGEFSVGCFTNLAPVIFANLVARFSERYPGISVNMVIGDQEEILQDLKSGQLETALMFDLGISDQFQLTQMATLPAKAVLPKKHRLARAKSLSLEELIDEPLILMDLPHTREYFLALFHALGLKPKVKYRSTSFEAVRTMVGNNLGYSILNLQPVTPMTYDGSEIVHVPLSDSVRPLNIVLVNLKRIAKRRAVTTFQDFARGYMKEWNETRLAARPKPALPRGRRSRRQPSV